LFPPPPLSEETSESIENINTGYLESFNF
jgi:hypothetical protein